MNEELPEGWARVPLADLLEPGGLFDGPFGSSLKTSDYTGAGVRVIRLENVANLRFIEDKQTFISESKYRSLTKHTVGEGDVIVGSFVDGAVRVCVLPSLTTKAIAKADCFTVRSRTDAADRRFVAFQLGTAAVHDTFVGDIHGATRPRITTKQLRACELAVAPLREQIRIVEKVEALLAHVNRAKARLERVPLILKRFRQSLMLAACSGRLTEAWRIHNPDLTVRSTRTDIDSSALPEIPESWGWVRLTDLGELSRGRSRHRPRNDPALYGGPYPFIQTGDVARSGGRIREHSQTYNAVGLGQSRLWPQDTVCITIAANIAESGILTYPACFPDSVVGLVANRQVCLPEYAEFFVRTARSSLSQFAPATAQKNINMEILSAEVAVPLPPVEEQIEIVRVAGSLLELADTIEDRAHNAATRAQKLPQAILSKAFSGELVPTEADLARVEGRPYETAEELLNRVTASRSLPLSGDKPRRARRRREAG